MGRRACSAVAGISILVAAWLVPGGQAVATATDPYSQAILGAGPVSYWRLGDSGTVAADELATNPGALGGGVATGEPGAIAGSTDAAMRLDGVNDWIGLGSSPSLRPQYFSIETWFRSFGQHTSHGFIARWRTFGWHAAVTLRGAVNTAVYGASGKQYVAESPGRYDDGEWHHLVAARGATSLSLIIDGYVVASVAVPEATRYESGGAAIGRDGNASGAYFNGVVDEFAFYDRPLTPAEAIAHYCLGGGSNALCNHAPLASAGDDQAVPEGSTATLDGSASTDPDGDTLTYSWELLEGTGPPVDLSGNTSARPSFAAADDGVYRFRLTVGDGVATATAETTVTITNVAPTASLTTEAGATRGATRAVVAFDDPGPLDTHTIEDDWGDGSSPEVVGAPDPSPGSVTAEHVYARAGNYTVTARVIDDDGGATTADTVVAVARTTPAASLWATSSANVTALALVGFDIEVSGLAHSNASTRVVGDQLRLLGGLEYADRMGIFGRANVVTPPAVRTAPSSGDWVGIADYRPDGSGAGAARAGFFDVSSRCRAGVWRPTTPLPSGAYYASCNVDLQSSVLAAPVTIAAEGTIDLDLRRGAHLEPFVDDVLLVSGSSRWNALVVHGDGADIGGSLVARSGGISVWGRALTFRCGLLADGIGIVGVGLRFAAPTCS
jgi:hypothetical protein